MSSSTNVWSHVYDCPVDLISKDIEHKISLGEIW